MPEIDDPDADLDDGVESLDEAALDIPGDDTDPVDLHELPGADLSHETLRVQVIPLQEDEFTCGRCFLATHRSRLAGEGTEGPYCTDCD